MRAIVARLADDRLALGSFAVFLIGFTLDTATTVHIVSEPHIVEVNPLIRAALHTGGAFGVIGIKLGVVGAFLAAVCAVYPPTHRRLSFVAAGYTIGVLWTAAGLWNLHLFLS
jgi:methionine aminopeptidase